MRLDMDSDQRERKSILAVNLGLVANIFLAALKTTIGILGHSPALLADGINSTSDAAYCIVISVFMRKASEPADTEHPYGHRQLESIAALVVGSFVITTAFAISHASDHSWVVTYATPITLAAGLSETLVISVQVPTAPSRCRGTSSDLCRRPSTR